MTLKTHRDTILSLDPVHQPIIVLEAFGEDIDRLARIAAERGKEACRAAAIAMHHAAIARLRSDIGVAGVRDLLQRAIEVNEAQGTSKFGRRARR